MFSEKKKKYIDAVEDIINGDAHLLRKETHIDCVRRSEYCGRNFNIVSLFGCYLPDANKPTNYMFSGMSLQEKSPLIILEV